MTKGTVYLTGAGPGDAGLLTCRGREVLEDADVVVYDRLIGEELLALCKPQAKRIYVGKAAGRHSMTQDEINAILVEEAKSGNSVCRLKGGDPFVFGRGGEEALFCLENGVDFEIIPGISSALAAPAYAGIPVTHRQVATSFAVVTGHTKEDNLPQLPQADTLVILMGVRALPQIVESLIKDGRSSATPAAVIRWGTTTSQQVVRGTLESIEDDVRRAKLTTPALIVVGDVVNLREPLQWFDKTSRRPLWGKTVVVTRAREQASALVCELAQLGANVIQCPTIRIAPSADFAALDSAIEQLESYDWLVFTSTNGVAAFWERLRERGHDVRLLAKARVVAIGPATAKALSHIGIIADLQPQKSISEDVAETMIQAGASGKVLLVRATKGREILQQKLAAAGMQVEMAPCYQTLPDHGNAAQVLDLLKQGRIDWVTFTSSSTVKNFVDALGAQTLQQFRPTFRVACIGPITAKTAGENKLIADVVAKSADTAELARAICEEKD